VLLMVRLPRIAVSLLTGAALAVGGAALQALFRNPLADPSLVGISSGAGLFAALAITAAAPIGAALGAWASVVSLPVMAFCGAFAAALFVLGIGRRNGRTSVAAMLLAGIGITALTGAFTGLVTYAASDTQLRSITFWMLGSLGGADRSAMLILAVTIPVPLMVVLRAHLQLNAITLGERQAHYLGVDVERTKWSVIAATALMVGSTVALCGAVGFVGLVVPHMLRLIGGADNRYLLPASLVGGALLMCLADTLARTLVAPAEIPIGVITALCGAPVFLLLLVRRERGPAF
jgi:iron complex transport system permease protein